MATTLPGTALSVPVEPASGCGGCHTSARAPEALEASTWERVREHPCYSSGAQHQFARLHLAVAPACNIQCNYCNRKFDCAAETRPGVVSELLNVDQAVKKALAVAAELPELAVVGIAGPGDALANPERSFAVFRELQRRAPDLRLCLSTNGLYLPEYVEQIVACGIDHVTITINCLDPEIGARIYPWIFWQHRRRFGREAAEILLGQQLKGLDALVARGVLVKVNSVLIPGLNDQHLPVLSRELRARGVFVHNVMPLISAAEHGTAFGLAGVRGPTDAELDAVRKACAEELPVMSHCQQCRADAVGKLDEDRGAEFSMARIEAMEIDEQAASTRRLAYRAEVANGRPARGRMLRMAVATRSGGRIDEHFGHAHEFQIIDVGEYSVRRVGARQVRPYCEGTDTCGDDNRDRLLQQTVAALADCELMLCARVGMDPLATFEAAGVRIDTSRAHQPIERAARALWAEWLEAGRLDRAPFAA